MILDAIDSFRLNYGFFACRFAAELTMLIGVIWFLVRRPFDREKLYDAQVPDSKEQASSCLNASFEKRLDLYNRLITRFRTNVKWTVVLVISSMSLLSEKHLNGQVVDKITLPSLGLSLPSVWLTSMFAAALIFTWFEYGYILNGLINNRACIWKLLDRIEVGLKQTSLFSRRSILEDNLFMDSWFALFHKQCAPKSYRRYRIYSILVITIFAILYGAAHGCLFALWDRLMFGWSGLIWLSGCIGLMIISALLLFTYAAFHLAAGNPSWFPWVSGLTCVVTVFGFAP